MKISVNERISKLRERMIIAPAICVERGYYMTQSYKETEGQPAVIRRAKALDKILSNMTIRIEDGELIVGWPTSKIRGGAVLPEIQCEWILDEMETFTTREWDKYAPLSEDEKEKLKEFIPYWKGKTLHEQWQQLVPKEAQKYNHIIQTSGGFSENGHHFAHVAVDYEKILRLGINGIKNEVEEELGRLNLANIDDLDKYHFLNGVKITFEAVIKFAKRYEELARGMAEKESDEDRKLELVKIADTCAWVPANPARNFYEALQSIWLIYIALMNEGWGAGMTLGRCDQYLYPFYKKDIEEGVLFGG